MANVFIAVNGDDVGHHIGNAIISDNHEELSRLSGSIKNAHQFIDQWVEQMGGKVHVTSGDEGIYSLPEEALSQLEDLRNEYKNMSGTTLTIGVGSTMSEASKALIYGKMNDKNQVVEYEPQIDDYISSEDMDDEDELPTPQEITEEGEASAAQEQGLDEEMPEEDEEMPEESEEQEGEPTEEPQAKMPLKDAIKEHKKLVGALKSPSKTDDQEELEEQSEELEDLEEQEESAEGEESEEDEDADFENADGHEEEESEEQSEEESEEQPEHEEDMSPEENFAHDAQEQEDDEEDADNIEADEEDKVLGRQTPPNKAGTPEDESQDADDDGIPDEDESEEEMVGDFDQDGDLDTAARKKIDLDGDGDSDAEIDEVHENTEDEEIPELSEDEIAQGQGQENEEMPEEESDEESEDDQSHGILSEMMHSNLPEEGEEMPEEGSEQSEDTDEEIRSDIAESLLAFKENKDMLEELKQSNPKLYQANILMLRSMIEMAKKLNMKPEQDISQASANKEMSEQMPDASEMENEEEQGEIKKP